MIPSKTAVERINVHIQTIQTRQHHMVNLYDYKPSTQTLARAFQQQGVHGRAMGYASSWGPNGVYLCWEQLQRFYTNHLVALEDSKRELSKANKPYVRAADLDYLDQGMAAWSNYEQQLPGMFDQYVQMLGKAAAFFDQVMALNDKRFSGGVRGLEPQIEGLSQQAKFAQKSAAAIADILKDIGQKQRFFSAITAPDRIISPSTDPKEKDDEEIHSGLGL